MGTGDGVAPTIITSDDLSVVVRGGGAVDLSTGGGPLIPPDQIEDLQGALDAAGVDAAASGETQIVRLTEGEYRPESAILIPAGVVLVGQGYGATVIDPSPLWVPDAADADDPDNAVVIIASGIGPVLATVTATSYGGPTLAVDVAIAPGTEVLIVSPSNTADIEVSGTDVIRYERARVVSVGAGPTLTFDRWLYQVHGIGVGQTQIFEVPTPADGAGLVGVDFRLEGRTFAVGVLVDAAHRAAVDVSGAGASRSLVHVRRGGWSARIKARSRGQNNALVYLESAHQTETLLDWDGSLLLGRQAALGFIRAGYTERHRCYGNAVTGRIGGFCCGGSTWGGMGTKVKVYVENCSMGDRATRSDGLIQMTAAAKGGASGWEICAVQTGIAASEIPYGQELDLSLDDCRVVDTLGNQGAFFAVNSRGHRVTSLDITNLGDTWNRPLEYATGIVLFDTTDITLDDVRFKGIQYALSIFGGWCRAQFGVLSWDPFSAVAGADSFILWGLYGNGFAGGQPNTLAIDSLKFVDEPARPLLERQPGANMPIPLEAGSLSAIRIPLMKVENRAGLTWRSVRVAYDASGAADFALERGAVMQAAPPTAVTVDPAPGQDTLTSAAPHGIRDGTLLFMRWTGIPTGAPALGTPVYARDVTATTMRVALTLGGAAVNFTAAGAGVQIETYVPSLVTPLDADPYGKRTIAAGTGWGFGQTTPAGYYLTAFGESSETRVATAVFVLANDQLVPVIGSRDAAVDNASAAPWRLATGPTSLALNSVGADRA